MAYMRFCGEVGRELYDRIAHCRRWLANGAAVAGLDGAERRWAEEELIAFLLNARFGEEAIIEQGFESQLDYIRQTNAWNPHCFKLLKGTEPLAVDAETPDGVLQMMLGYARGVSMVVPMTKEGFEAYTGNEIWSLEIRRKHVVPPDEVPASPCYVYFGTLFDFFAMPRLLGERGRLVETVGLPPDSTLLLLRVFRHAAWFLPRITYDREGQRYIVRRDRSAGLPTFICATDSVFGERLVRNAGFEPYALDEEKRPIPNKIGYPIFQLRLADVNDEAQPEERRKLIRKTIDLYRRILKLKSR